MLAIKINIVRFIDDHQPGFVECKFSDAWGREFTVHEKVPVVTQDNLDSNSRYPQTGVIACKLIKQWSDKDGRTMITVNTEHPWGVETIEGVLEFDLVPEQLIEL